MSREFTKIAIRNIPRRRLRNALTIIAIMLGVSLVIGVNIGFENVFAQFQRAMVVASGNVDIEVTTVLGEPFPLSTVDTISGVKGVAEVSPRVMGFVGVFRSINDLEGATGVSVFGVDTTSDFEYLDPNTTMITRTLPHIPYPVELRANSTDAVVDENLNYDRSTSFFVYTDLDFNQIGSFDPDKLFSFIVRGTYHPPATAAQFGQGVGGRIYVDIAKAQTMFGYGSEINTVIVRVVDIDQTDAVVESLEKALGSDYAVESVKGGFAQQISDATVGLRSGLQVMSVMALSVAIIIVLNTTYMNVGERTYEVGILRSTGASTRQVFWIFFSESLILGAVGAAIGLFVGIMMTSVFHYLALRIFAFQQAAFTLQLSIAPEQVHYIFIGIGAGMIAALMGGLFPSLSACRIDVIRALRPGVRWGGKKRTALKLVAVGLPLTIIGSFMYAGWEILQQVEGGMFILSLMAPLPVAGVVFLAAGSLRAVSPLIERLLIFFGGTRKIITRNIERNLRRTTICFALIGISLSFVLVMGGAQVGVMTGIEDLIRSFTNADLMVISEVSPIPVSFAQDLNAIAGVELASPILIVPTSTVLTKTMSPPLEASSLIMAIDPSTYPQVTEMRLSDESLDNAMEELDNAGNIILADPLARKLSASVGEVIDLRARAADDSNTTWSFTIIGVAEGAFMEMMSFGDFAMSDASYVSYKTLNSTFPEYVEDANLFFVKVKSDQDIDFIEEQIVEMYEYDLFILSYTDILQTIQGFVDEMFVILYSVVLFAVVNAIIGVAAIMVMNVSERKREIGILRSQGMSRSQVVLAIVGEASVLGVVGFLVGTMIGLIFHRISITYMSLMGFPLEFFVPYDGIVIILFLALITSIMSAVYPAFSASRLNIVDAIRGEKI